MNERDYIRLKRQVEERYQRDLEAIERVWEMTRNGASGGSVKTEEPKVSDAGTQRVEGLTEAIKSVIQQQPGSFTIRTIIRDLGEYDMDMADQIKDKPASVSSALKRLEKSGEIKVVQTGRGKRPSEYRMRVGSDVSATISAPSQDDTQALTPDDVEF